MNPAPKNPRIIIAQVDVSGTAVDMAIGSPVAESATWSPGSTLARLSFDDLGSNPDHYPDNRCPYDEDQQIGGEPLRHSSKLFGHGLRPPRLLACAGRKQGNMNQFTEPSEICFPNETPQP